MIAVHLTVKRAPMTAKVFNTGVFNLKKEKTTLRK